MKPRAFAAIIISLLASAAFAPAASAAVGDPSVEQCFSSAAISSCTQLGDPQFTGADVEVSPDGAQVYMLGIPGVIRIFDRGADHKLTPRAGADGCYNSNGANGCTVVPGFGEPSNTYDLDFSPDGRSLYASAGASFAHLRRDPQTGSLTPATCYGVGGGCTPITPLSSVYTVVVSRDGQSVYTQGTDKLGVFQRDTSTGALILEPDGEDCFSEAAVANCANTYGLAGSTFEMDFSPDGKFLYSAIQSPGGIGFFQRNANGTLARIAGTDGGCITGNGASGSTPAECFQLTGSGAAMSSAWAATVSPSGGHVFVSGASGTVVFSRNQASGKLTKVSCIAPTAITGCDQRLGSAGMGVAVSPDGKRAIVGANDIGGVGVSDFNEATGALSQLAAPLGCFSGLGAAGCSAFPGGSQRGKVDWAPDGLNFYATAGGPLISMARDYPPVCQDRTATVPSNAVTAVGLSCSDPNGDPVTMQISRGPASGGLAAIDQAASSVLYNPFSGYLGLDSFGYQGVARGVSSAEANVTLNVQALTISETPRLSNEIDDRWKPFKTHTTVKKLTVVGATTDVTLRLSCKGRGCPFAGKTIDAKKAGDQSLVKLFNFSKKVKGKTRKIVSKLGVGAVVEIRIASPGSIGKVVRYTMRKSKQPVSTTLCTPPGSSKPQSSC